MRYTEAHFKLHHPVRVRLYLYKLIVLLVMSESKSQGKRAHGSKLPLPSVSAHFKIKETNNE